MNLRVLYEQIERSCVDAFGPCKENDTEYEICSNGKNLKINCLKNCYQNQNKEEIIPYDLHCKQKSNV